VSYWDSAFAAFVDLSLAGRGEVELLPGLAARYLERLGTLAAGSARVVDKMPANFLYLGLIHAALPRARIIHMQRHPIDTCLSIYFQNFPGMGAYGNDLDNLAFYYGEYARLMAHWRSLLPIATFLDVPYEGLVENQETWTRRMLEFIGLPWDARCLDFHNTQRMVVTASRWQVRQKMSRASTGRWRNYATFLGPLERLASLAP
jgi:hypothetical protein